MIEDIIFWLSDKFPEYDWDLDYIEGLRMYIILVNDWEFYRSKKYDKMLKIMRKKYPEVRFSSAYKKFSYGE